MGLIAGQHAVRWPGGCAPYAYDENQLTPEEVEKVETAVAKINDTGFVRLIKRTTQSRYIDVVPDYQPLDGVCWSSHTGMSGGRQEVRLDPGKGTGVIIHEFLHALGVSHEQKRPDRDDFIHVRLDKVSLSRRGDFEKAYPPGAIAVGPYDLDSIMHYGPSLPASVNGQTAIISTDNLHDRDRIGQRSRLSDGDKASLAALDGGSVLVAGLDAAGQIGSVVDMASWGDGFNLASSYSMAGATFLFSLQSDGGKLRIRDIAASGALGAVRDERTWSSGWTTALPYARGPQRHLLLYKTSTGLLRLHALTPNGTVGQKFEESTPVGDNPSPFGAGWTSIAHYTVGDSDYLFFLRQGTGEMQVHGVAWNGGLAQRLQQADWSSGWTTAQPFTTSGGQFLFLLKSGDGQMNINTIKNDGRIGAQVPTTDWTPGWTIARPFIVGNQTFIFLVKSATGQVQINRINANGTIGSVTDRRQFAPGWTAGTVVQQGRNAAIVLIKA
jgi:hypothetical protein